MIVFIKLLLAHLLGDFVLQPNSWVKDKQERKIKSVYLYLHAGIHGILVLVLLWDLSYLLLALLITIVHWGIDLLKIYAEQEQTGLKWFLLDQFFHIISITGLYIAWSKPDIVWADQFNNMKIWLLLTSVLWITWVASLAIGKVLQNWTKEISTEGDDSLTQAGTWIGILERLFAFLFVITGNWAPIGFLLAAKSVFRFGDLRTAADRKLTEYILIGTLLSFGIAIVTGLIFNHLINR